MNKKVLSRIKNNICCEDISLIENYDKMIKDENNKYGWVCHHKLEIELNKSRQELKDLNLYYHRPASELIFLPYSEHSKLHNTGNHYNNGRKCSEETKKKLSDLNNGKTLSEETKMKISQTLKDKGIKPPSRKGCKLSEAQIDIIRISHLGKPRSEETKRKISETLKFRNKNLNNSSETLF